MPNQRQPQDQEPRDPQRNQQAPGPDYQDEEEE